MEGYIKLHRKILDNPIVCKDADHFAVWCYLILSATHQKRAVIFAGKKITLFPGQLITGRKIIAEKFNISESKVERILKSFKSEQQIEQQTSSVNRLITILQWVSYQKSEQQNEQRVDNEWTTSGQRVNTNNNDKNDNNDNNPPLSSPPLHEILHRSGYERLEDDDEKNYFKRAIESLWNTKSRSVDGKRLSEADIKLYLESISFDIIQTISDRVNFYDIKNPVNYLKTALLKELVGNTGTSSQSGHNKLECFGDMDYDSLDKKIVEKMINRAKKQ